MKNRELRIENPTYLWHKLAHFSRRFLDSPNILPGGSYKIGEWRVENLEWRMESKK